MTESNEISIEYRLPDWFLRCNVRASAESVITSGGVILPLATEVGDKIDTIKEAVSGEALTVEDPIKDKVVYDNNTFSELRDATAASLVCDAAGELMAPHGTIVVRSPTKDGLSMIDSLLLGVAADLEATLVMVDLEDLNDLGWEFDYQDRRAMRVGEIASKSHDGQNMFHALGLYYFGAASKEKYGNDENWNRSMTAIEALINIPRFQQHPSSGENLNTNSGTPVADGSPLLLYVRNYNEMASVETGHRFIKRIWDSVQTQRRSRRRRVVLLVSLFKCPDECDCKSSRYHRLHIDDRYPGERHFNKICPDPTFVITIDPENADEARSEHEEGLQGDINFRRLKRFLRCRIPHLLNPGLAEAVGVNQPFSYWTAQGFQGQYEPLAASVWTVEEFQRATTRIAGRAFGKSKLDFDGVHNVLLSMGLYRNANDLTKVIDEGGPDESEKEEEAVDITAHSDDEKSTVGSDEESNESSDEDTPKKLRPAETWSEKLRRITRNANGFEKDLIGCIVNPDNLQATFDDVIIDEETKETISYLVSLSNFQPEAASESLLKHIRVTGALLYGPPGTGKTHLSRAIAKASGSSMLSIDSATMQSKWVGDTEKYIRAAFSLSVSLFPCVLFIDEVDALFYRRSSGDVSWQRSALAQFLSEMDGLSHSDKAPFVVVATNRPQDLDEAFYRRLPHKVYFKLPDLESRIRILQIFLKKEDLDPSVDLKGLAGCTDGYSGSDLRSLCAEAAMNWAIEQLKKGSDEEKTSKLFMNASHFAKALLRIRPSVSPQLIDDFSEFARRFNPDAIDNSFLDAEIAPKIEIDYLEKMIATDRKEGQTLLVLNSRECIDDPTRGELSQALEDERRPISKPHWVGSLSNALENWLLQPDSKVGDWVITP